jgi:hypothetical protein
MTLGSVAGHCTNKNKGENAENSVSSPTVTELQVAYVILDDLLIFVSQPLLWEMGIINSIINSIFTRPL